MLFEKVHTQKLVGRDVQLPAVYKLRDDWLLKQAGPEDTIVVFVAGHAVRTDADEYWFLTAQATAANPYPGLPRNLIDSLVGVGWNKLAAKRRLLLIDTCHAGEEVTTRAGPRLYGERDAKLRGSKGGLYVLAASTDSGFAREQAGNGLFTRALLDGLRGAADNGDGVVHVDELLPFVQRRVRERSGGRQQPTMPRVEGGQDFPLFRVSKR